MTSHHGNSFNSAGENNVDINWYTDNRATNLVTADYTNLTNPIEYGGKEQVTVGSGDKLNIASIGHSDSHEWKLYVVSK